MQSKFFYIIYRDGQIFEIKYDERVLAAVMKAWQEKALIVLKGYGAGLNGVDITKVLNADQYENYISSVKPREYVKNGVWKDGKEHQTIRVEKWRQDELDQARLPPPKDEPDRSPKEVKKLFNKYRPEFMKNSSTKQNDRNKI